MTRKERVLFQGGRGLSHVERRQGTCKFYKAQKSIPHFWETDAFKELQRQWYRKAAESGFQDLETPDGSYCHQDSEAEIVVEDLELASQTWSRAHTVLSDEDFWDGGLTPAHRRFWALIMMGVSVEKAGLMVHRRKGGGGRAKSHRWHAEILKRIESQ